VRERAPATPEQAADGENLYLLGRPTLRQFMQYVRGHAVNAPGNGALRDQWRAARAVVETLEREESGAADDPPMGKLGPEYEPLLLEFFKDPLVRHGFNTVPTDIALVELDRLVIYQKHIDLVYARQLERRLGPAPDRDVVFRTCLPYDHPHPPVKVSRLRSGGFVVMSPSNDLRSLGPMPLGPRHVSGYPSRGSLVRVLGIGVGFGVNFLNAVYAERRLILNNGSHRAYALRKLGVTHVPCIVQHVSSRDELEIVASDAVRRDPDNYLKHPRPAMLRDYFDPRLCAVMPVQRRLRQVTVRFQVEVNDVPAL
jgi:hypothetical protein